MSPAEINRDFFPLLYHLFPSAPKVRILSSAETSSLVRSLAEGRINSHGFGDDYQPFTLGKRLFDFADNYSGLQDAFYFGVSGEGDLYFYAEVIDDHVQLKPSNDPETKPWDYDVIELGWSNFHYTAAEEGGYLGIGNPYNMYTRGKNADHHITLE